ncbi:MAG: DUF192 domain-containing protein [Hydrogenophilaceae bacterium]|nr:DUF192 domain-containing protein [Hydrogenophilaceae bacterium]
METRRAFYQVTLPLRRLIAASLLLSACLQAGQAAAEGCAEVWDGRRWQPVALAETEAEHAAGLSGRPPGGMLFVYPRPEVRWIWMQGMSFDLDIVWLDAERRALAVERLPVCGESPCPLYPSPGPVSYVLELPAGGFAGQIGQRLDWRDC